MKNSTDLRNAGLKATIPRLKILGILEQSTARHMTAEDNKALLDAGEEIGLATVYRVLTQFQAAGLVIRHNFEGGRSVFELDPGTHHDHMVCLECGRVFEFVDPEIEARQKQVAEQADFVIDDHALYIYGVCRGMRENGVCSKKR
ncbi:MAG: ferric iron uptake transcriptional regulator [Acidiferrobacteraceae bacterium]